MHFDVSELRDLEGDLEKGAAKVAAAAPQVVKKVAFDIERDAKVFAPLTLHPAGTWTSSRTSRTVVAVPLRNDAVTSVA